MEAEPIIGDVLIDKAPKTYNKQGLTYCGGFAAKAILEAYDIETPDDPSLLYSSRIGQWTGLNLGPKTWEQCFQQHGLSPEVGSVRCLTPDKRIALLQSFVRSNVPIMLRISNGYYRFKGKMKYSKLLASIMGHWITIWGYNDEQQKLYVYDSGVQPDAYEAVPVGNISRSYDRLLLDWKGGFSLHPYSGIYIAVRKEMEKSLTNTP